MGILFSIDCTLKPMALLRLPSASPISVNMAGEDMESHTSIRGTARSSTTQFSANMHSA